MPDKQTARGAKTRAPEYQLRLYVAGQSPRSIAALSNLKRICELHLGGRYAIEVIDLVEHPHLAKTDEIIALPTLVRRLPAPIRKIIGDLSNVDRVLVGLDVVNLAPGGGGGGRVSSDSIQIEEVTVSREEADETLRAIRSGRVDAIVVNGANGHEVLTFRDPDHACRALLEAMGESAALVTPDGVICYHNQRLSTLTVGPSAGSLRGRALRTLVASDAASSVDSLLERAQRGPARIEVDLVAADGSHLAVQMTATAGSVGDVPVLCVVITDLSGQRLQEDLYREALVGMEARERLLSVAGHELRAPLQNLLFELSVVLEQQRSSGNPTPDAATAIAHVESIFRQGQHLASLVGSLLDVGLLRSEQLELSLEDLDLAEVVRAVLARSQSLSGSSAVELEARAVTGRWDRLRLEQVVTNLLSNAGKYGLGRPIRIVVDGDDDVARLVVEDQGVGIPPDAIERLFRPFSRVGSVKSAAGLGLGLYITAHIVKAHRGVIRVESKAEVVTRFIVELPRVTQHGGP